MRFAKMTKVGALAVAAAFALSACGASNSSGDSKGGSNANEDKNWANCKPAADAKDVSSDKGDKDKKKEIKIAANNGWDESFAVSHLLKNNLEKKGYKVTIKAFDAAPSYVAVADGKFDFLVDGWLPKTHADYIKKYGDKLDSQGCWYDNGTLTIAVNKDSKAKSIGDLKTMGKEYGGTLYGIEQGAGLTKAAQQAVKDYKLDGSINFKPSSTPAMLAQLKKSTKAHKDIAVTMWRPHWAYNQFPIRDLKDPKGSMGKAEKIYNFSNKDFTKSNPMVAQLLKNLVFDDKKLFELEDKIQKAGQDNIDDAVSDWVKDNPDWVSKWEKGELKPAD